MKNIICLLLLCMPFAIKAQKIATLYSPITLEIKIDTVRVFMLVSDTSTIEELHGGYNKQLVKISDTRPFTMYGYRTGNGTLLDAYKNPLHKNIVMWIAYPIQEPQRAQSNTRKEHKE